MKYMTLALILGVCSLSAQTIVGIQGGMSFRGNDFNRADFMFSPLSWNNGLTIGIQTDFSITKTIAVRTSAEYNHYSFDHFQSEGPAPPDWRIGSSSGHDAESYRVALEGVYSLRLSKRYTALFLTGIGYAEERNGAVWFSLVNKTDGTERTTHAPKRFKPFLFHSFGLGVRHFLTRDLGIELIAKNQTNYATRFHQALNLAVILNLN